MKDTWKEGRHGAASLCYAGLTEPDLARIVPLHARVGIRATLLVPPPVRVPPLLAGRNWEIAPDPLQTVHPDGVVAPEGDALSARMVPAPPQLPQSAKDAPASCMISRHAPRLSSPLPTIPADPDPHAFRDAVEAVVAEGAWVIWWIPRATLHEWGEEGFAGILRWLGDHHARIWCAPVRDIAQWLWEPDAARQG